MTRQTRSFLIERLREIGLQPDARHGQNFLIDLNLVELLVRTADVGPEDVVLEVGTGTGSLTQMLAERAAHVVTVEIDQHLFRLASQQLEGAGNVTMLHQDALKNKNNLHPHVIATVAEQLRRHPQGQFRVAANLPYNIATPVISNLLLVDTVPQTMTVTIQKELADRITASPGTKDYGALSIWVQSQCDAEIVRIMPPSVFWPQPKVHSAIIQISLQEERRRRISDLPSFHNFVRSMFLHRRKFLRGVMVSGLKGQLDKAQIDQIMGEMHLGADSRAEQLDVQQMLALHDLVRQRTDA